MKRILTFIAVFVIFTGYSQDCYNTGLGMSYIYPKGTSVEVSTLGKLAGGIGLVYNSLSNKEKGSINQTYSLDILAYGGVRVYHKEYRTAVYANIGYLMGLELGPRLYFSSKLMLLRNQKAMGIEPYYSERLGLKLTLYLRI